MAPVARELAADHGILEPLQTAETLEGEVLELHRVLAEQGELPLALVGSSWGAMLGFIVAARYPEIASKLILVGSGVYEERYAAGIQETRLKRLNTAQRLEVAALTRSLDDPGTEDRDAVMARLGALFTRADAYAPLTLDTELIGASYAVYRRVWGEAVDLRRRGGFLELGKQIRCPVLALHGDYDPHPAPGIEEPLSRVIRDFRFVRLTRCGHLPWLEREARESFFRILRAELGQV